MLTLCLINIHWFSLDFVLNQVFRIGRSKLAFNLLTFATSIGATGLTRMVSKNLLDQSVGPLFKQIDNGVVQGILVLFEPSRNVVWHL